MELALPDTTFRNFYQIAAISSAEAVLI